MDLQEGLWLHGKAVSAGNVFWAEDESALKRMRRELEDANETIEMENDLLRYENEQKEERAPAPVIPDGGSQTRGGP